MRKLKKLNLAGIDPRIQSAFGEVFNASQEADVVDIGNAYTISGTFTATRTLNVTSPTLANIAAVLATLISDLQRGGATKTT